jgi:predicted DsbA family dithiol-disulfide isomerase
MPALLFIIMEKMKVDIWSDVVCPFCYIGKRQFEIALDKFEHKEKVEVRWHSFQLDPNTPKPSVGNTYDMLSSKYGITREKAVEMTQGVVEMASLVGLHYNMENTRPANTFDAHRLIHLAAQKGWDDKAEERFFSAYFTEGKDIADEATLKQLATEIGLETTEIDTVLASDQYADAVRIDQLKAKQMGITGVPFFVINEKYGISGAQGGQTILKALQGIWAENNPETSTGNSCDVDGENC